MAQNAQKVVLKRLGVLSVAKLYTLMMGVFGFFIGLVYALLGAGYATMMGSPAVGAGFGVAALIFIPLIYAIIGFVAGVLSASLYNLFAGWLGGIEMEFQQ